MNKQKIEIIVNSDEDISHYFNTVLIIAKGYGIKILESSVSPLKERVEQSIPKKEEKNLYFDINEASEILKLTRSTLYKYTSENSIPYYKLGNKILFNRIELEQWISERKVK